MEVTLEEVDPGSGEDAFAAWAEVLLASLPYTLATSESVRHESAHHRHLLARADGEPAGVARARPGSGEAPAFLTVAVRPQARGQGVGSTLAREALRRLSGLGGDEERVLAVVEPDEHSAAVAAHWGFSGDRLGRVARVDATTGPAALAEPPPV